MTELKFEGSTYLKEGEKYFAIDGFGAVVQVSPLTEKMLKEFELDITETG